MFVKWGLEVKLLDLLVYRVTMMQLIRGHKRETPHQVDNGGVVDGAQEALCGVLCEIIVEGGHE